MRLPQLARRDWLGRVMSIAEASSLRSSEVCELPSRGLLEQLDDFWNNWHFWNKAAPTGTVYLRSASRQ